MRSGMKEGETDTPERDFNPYRTTPEELIERGCVAYSLCSVTPHPRVGNAVTCYNYAIDGRITTRTVPAESFDPMTSPNEVLDALGMPRRPDKDDPRFDGWAKRYGHRRASNWAKPPPYIVVAEGAPGDNRPIISTSDRTADDQ